jgi:hypothetical protein
MSDDDDAQDRALAVRGGLTRGELARLRRGELDADTIRALLKQTRGLGAPEAPPEGDLVPNGTGWRIGAGGPTLRLYPRLLKWALWTGAFLSFVPNWGIVLGLPSLLTTMAANLAPLATFLGGVRLATEVTLRRLQRAPSPERLADCPSGTAVRVSGVVVSSATVPTLFRGAPAVLFCSKAGFAQQTQGIDFELDLDSGDHAWISVRRAMILDRPDRVLEPLACGPVLDHENRLASAIFTARPSRLGRLLGSGRYYEAAVGPGDRIEIYGVLHHEPAPEALAPFARQMPTRAVIRAPRNRPLLVRRLG